MAITKKLEESQDSGKVHINFKVLKKSGFKILTLSLTCYAIFSFFVKWDPIPITLQTYFED